MRPVSREDFGSTALTTCYEMHQANADLPFYVGPAELQGVDGSVVPVTGNLSVKWLPTPSTVFEGTTGASHFIQLDNSKLRVPGVEPLDGFVFSTNPSRSSVSWLATGGGGFGKGPLSGLMFHVINFPLIYGRAVHPVSQSPGSFYSGRLILDSPAWEVTVDPVETYAVGRYGLRDSLRASGGYAITHVGYARRRSGRPISIRSANQLLDELTFFFTMCRGAWSPACLPIGFDSHRQFSWQDTAVARVHPSRSVESWLPIMSSGPAESMYVGFAERWIDRAWSQTVRLLISFYAEANAHPSTEIGIVVAQSALELFAWKLFVDSGQVTKKHFRGLTAAQKIRKLLLRAGISSKLPRELATARHWAHREGWADAPEVIAWTRNGITHPTMTRFLGKPARLRVEVKWLSIYYVELLLLWLFDYHGQHLSRIRNLAGLTHVGDTTPVPWA